LKARSFYYILLIFFLISCVQQPEKEEEDGDGKTQTSVSVGIDSTGLGELVSKSLTARTITISGYQKYKILHLGASNCSTADFTHAAYQTSGSFTFTPHADSVNIVCAIGVDSKGVMSLVMSSRVLTIDLSLPSVFINSTGLGSSPSRFTSNRTISITGAPRYKILHRVSNTCTGANLSATPITTSSTFTFTPVANANNIICVIGINNDGVETPIRSSDVLTIDTISPTVTVHSNGLGPSPSGNLGQRIITASGASTYKYILKDGTDCTGVDFSSVSERSSSFTFIPIINTNNIVCVQGYDAAKNVSTVVASNVLVIDGVPPVVTLGGSHGPSPSSNTSNRTITVSGALFYRYVRRTGVNCDGVNFAVAPRTASNFFTYTPVNNANNIVCIQGEDNAGNFSDTVSTTVLTIDTIDPNIPSLGLFDPISTPNIDDTPTLRISNNQINEVLSVYSDASCTTLLKSETITSIPFEITLPSIPLGANTFYGKTVDGAGNASNCSSALSYFREITFNDPLYSHAWHLNNTGQNNFSNANGRVDADLNVTDAWIMGATGNNIKIAVSDEAIDVNHPDLTSNILLAQSMDYAVSDSVNNVPSTPTGDEMHGTAVSGIIGASANNNMGSIGIAHEASIATLNFLSPSVTQNLAVKLNQASGDFDIFNYSYGSAFTCAYNPTDSTYLNLLEANTGNTVSSPGALRSGKGAIYVKSAGNSFFDSYNVPACPMWDDKQHNDTVNYFYLGNSNIGGDAHTPYIIITGAYNARGVKSSYSSIGSNLWISAPGGEHGISEDYYFNQPFGLSASEYNANGPAMMTTDLPGCVNGSSHSGAGDPYPFNKGDTSGKPAVIGKNSNCDYTNTMNGTSSAAPSLSGVIALMLDVNPNLSWRDVRHILASTAYNPVSDPLNISFKSPPQGHPFRFLPIPSTVSGRTFQRPWVLNGGGYMFHNWYGFGKVNAHAAVQMAQGYSVDLKTFTSFSTALQSPALGILDPTAGTPPVARPVSDTVNVTRTNFFVENVEVTLNITHPYVGDLGIEITSPTGTISQILYMNSGVSQANFSNVKLISNAFYGESADGNWKIEVVDGDVGQTGTLDSYQIKFYGHDR
jgi:subtilisin-like proprotein convertase family protein/subtilisin family serine protease